MPPFRRYFEPFLGGGALLYLAAHRGAVAGDVYEPLIELWRHIQSEPEEVIGGYRQRWARLQRDGPEYFYAVRARFNRRRDPLDLCFLLRTCVNGITRFNAAGEFNNSFHLSRPGMDPERFAAAVRAWNRVLTGVSFVCRDYEATLADARAGDFAYLDPPYAGNRQRYLGHRYLWHRSLTGGDCANASPELPRLWTVLEDLNRRGVRWALSFDGGRGGRTYPQLVPAGLYRRRLVLASGHSAVHKVLNGPLESVRESLYLNY